MWGRGRGFGGAAVELEQIVNYSKMQEICEVQKF
jgi:hypothetical protein